MLPVEPPKVVTVQRDDQWHLGSLEAWRRDDIGWLGYVRYSVAAGMMYLEWVDAERLRPA